MAGGQTIQGSAFLDGLKTPRKSQDSLMGQPTPGTLMPAEQLGSVHGKIEVLMQVVQSVQQHLIVHAQMFDECVDFPDGEKYQDAFKRIWEKLFVPKEPETATLRKEFAEQLAYIKSETEEEMVALRDEMTNALAKITDVLVGQHGPDKPVAPDVPTLAGEEQVRKLDWGEAGEKLKQSRKERKRGSQKQRPTGQPADG